ncbi:MAG: diguanylate cyclase [Acidobacteriota bacterium]
MNGTPVRVLLIEHDAPEAADLREALVSGRESSFDVTWSDSLATSVPLIEGREVDVVVLDIDMPAAAGLATVRQLIDLAPELPLVVLTSRDDDETGLRAVQLGAQDFLVRNRVTPDLIVRSIRYSIERQRLLEALRGLAMIDDLTGLYNRRGFRTLAEHQVKMAQRTRRQLLLIFADLDGFKQINDQFGHQEGDIALMETAEAFRRTFRGSDVVARLGGDEFVVLAFEPTGISSDAVVARLQENLRVATTSPGRPYSLSLSTGAIRFDPWNSPSILELIAQVDRVMYTEKSRRRM